MARFYPLYVRRSDGKDEVVMKGKRKERNEPTTEQLDQKPDKNGISDFYREVSPDEVKHLDWRRKLGGMLARELQWKDKTGQDSGYILATFPEHYRLYEHVKKTEKDGKTEVKNKTHAGGGNDRQDAYLYGHPEGRRKRFRSPADFFPHLLWLCTDESGDPDNCGCKICSPEDLEAAIPGAKVKVESIKPSNFANDTNLVRRSSASSTQTTKVKQEPNAPVPVQRPVSAPRQMMPTPLPVPRTADQHIDSRYQTFMYRPGEMVWFRRGQAWGLGVVLRRWRSPPNEYNYTVQQLSYPGADFPAVTKSSTAELRPWLAWSVPVFTNTGLNNLPNPPTYATADWEGISQKRYGTGDLTIDASILAAKDIDASYTPFGLNGATEPEAGVRELSYDGIFLGAEKVWIGEPVRKATGSGTDILVVHSIIEQRRTEAPQQQNIYLIGDVYTLVTINHSNPAQPTPASIASNPQLPQRLTEDLAYRNARSIPAKRTASYWKLQSTQTRLDINDVKGRWYEASLLLPILQTNFAESERKGEIPEASLWMNSRGDSLNSNRAANLPKVPRLNVRREARREALGRAVPTNCEIRDGIEPPLPQNVDPALAGIGTSTEPMEIDPRFETADGVHLAEATVETGNGMDEFMNLEGVDEHGQMPGFGQDYGSQAPGQGYY